jgi:hypothetical protein
MEKPLSQTGGPLVATAVDNEIYMNRRDFLRAATATASLIALSPSRGYGQPTPDVRSGETLYNGIQLPSPWPPRLSEFPTSVEKDPVVPPYLTSPPAIIPIDLGRQLFVDDFLISDTTLKRTWHLPEYHPASPVLKPDRPWEGKKAIPYSDGVWYDPQDRLFKIWYSNAGGTAYATSRDGIEWQKPGLDVVPGTNIVNPGDRDSSMVWLDHEERDPKRRFKMLRVVSAGSPCPVTGWNNWVIALEFSEDGVHWKSSGKKSGRVIDRSTVFWNPFRRVWVYSIRHAYAWSRGSYGFERRRSYVENADIMLGLNWEVGEPLPWIDIDRLDPQREDLNVRPQLYNLDAVAYESLLLGFFTVWRGQPGDRHKPNTVVMGYSRDGWHWSRPDRRPFCPITDKQGDWNANNVQSAGGGCLVVGDRLYFYVSGRAGEPGTNKAGICSTGLAVLRRDGFASLDSDENEGTVTTRTVRFSGKRLFVNVDCPHGKLCAEVLNERGNVIEPFTRMECLAVSADKALQEVRWKEVTDLSRLSGKPVRFRFYLSNGRLYSFWLARDESGASQGYVAAGGPGFPGPVDTAGIGAADGS